MPRQVELNRDRIRVAAGILIDRHGRFLITDRIRAQTFTEYWEFPGGKIRDGESAPDALKRELAEELGIEMLTIEPFESLEHDYADFAVAIDFFLVRDWRGTPVGREHQSLKWITPSELCEETLLPADAPLVAALKKFSKH